MNDNKTTTLNKEPGTVLQYSFTYTQTCKRDSHESGNGVIRLLPPSTAVNQFMRTPPPFMTID